MGCGRGNDVTYPNKASFGARSVSKLALFEYVMSFPLPHPIKILTMLHQVVTCSFLLWAPDTSDMDWKHPSQSIEEPFHGRFFIKH